MRAKGALHSALGPITAQLFAANANANELQATIDALEPRIAIVDETGRFLCRNARWIRHERSARRTKPLSSAQAYLRSYGVTSNIPLDEAPAFADALQAVIAGSRSSFSWRHKPHHPKTRRCFEMRATKIADHPKRILILHKDVSDVVQAEMEAQETMALLFTARDHERKRIARELHDTTVQDLVSIKLFLERMDQSVGVARILGLLDRSLSDLRALSFLFHPPLLDDYGLRAALSSYIDGFRRRTGIKAAFHAPQKLPTISSEVQQTLYYIVQEALTNVYRHSGSKVASVSLSMTHAGAVTVAIVDQGTGLGAASVPNEAPGVGISGMRARARLYNGVLTVRSGRGGTTVCAEFPSASHGIPLRERLR